MGSRLSDFPLQQYSEKSLNLCQRCESLFSLQFWHLSHSSTPQFEHQRRQKLTWAKPVRLASGTTSFRWGTSAECTRPVWAAANGIQLFHFVTGGKAVQPGFVLGKPFKSSLIFASKAKAHVPFGLALTLLENVSNSGKKFCSGLSNIYSKEAA